MRKLKLLLDPKTYGRKPEKGNIEYKFTDKKTGKEIKYDEPAAVSSRLIKNQVEITIEELANKALEGHSWTVAHYNENEATNKISRTKECWSGQDIFALDIDNGVSPCEALIRCTKFGIMPSFIYTSFSDTPELRKFRIVFVSEATVTDYRDANTITLALMELFPEADGQCKDLSRLYYGGKESYFFSKTNTINPLQVMEAFTNDEFNKDQKNYKRNIKAFASITGLTLTNGLPTLKESKNEEKGDDLYIYIGEHTFPQIWTYDITREELILGMKTNKKGEITYKKQNITDDKIKHELIEKFDFEQYYEKCPLRGALEEGILYPYDDEFFGIALNDLRIKGGEKRLKEALKNSKVIPEDMKEYYTNKISYYKNSVYQAPMRCEKFCPRYINVGEDAGTGRNETRLDTEIVSKCEGCENTGVNMLHSVELNKRAVRRIEDTSYTPVTEANEIFTDALREGITDGYMATTALNRINLLLGSAGLGKSTSVGNVLAELAPQTGLEGILICYPNHKLGKDLADRLQIPNALYVKELELEDEDILLEYRQLQNIGDYSGAREVLQGYIQDLVAEWKKDSSKKEENTKIIDTVKEFLDTIKEARTTKRPILCTHARMLHLNNKHIHTIIIDEDIIPSVVKTVNVDLSIINQLQGIAKTHQIGSIESILDHIDNLAIKSSKDIGAILETNMRTIKKEDMKKMIKAHKLDINLEDLLNIKAIVSTTTGNGHRIDGYVKVNLPSANIIVMSATANGEVYKRLFNDREVIVTDTGVAEQQGKIILHNGSNSRHSLNQKGGIKRAIKRVQEEAPNVKNLITYKSYKHHFEKAGFITDMHFYRCVGEDSLKGQDIVVLGTPNANESAYILLAHACGVRENVRLEISYQEVTRNGFEFYFQTHNQQDLSPTGNFMREIQFYLIESELEQAVGRARILREDCTVHLFSNYPLKTVTEIYGQNY